MKPSFAAVLRSLREARGMSQAELARRAEIDSGYLTRCEQGQRVPTSPELVERMAAALASTREEANTLLVAAGFFPPELERVGPADPEILLLARLLAPDTLSATVREGVRAVIRGLGQVLLTDHPSEVRSPPASTVPADSPGSTIRRRRRSGRQIPAHS